MCCVARRNREFQRHAERETTRVLLKTLSFHCIVVLIWHFFTFKMFLDQKQLQWLFVFHSENINVINPALRRAHGVFCISPMVYELRATFTSSFLNLSEYTWPFSGLFKFLIITPHHFWHDSYVIFYAVCPNLVKISVFHKYKITLYWL